VKIRGGRSSGRTVGDVEGGVPRSDWWYQANKEFEAHPPVPSERRGTVGIDDKVEMLWRPWRSVGMGFLPFSFCLQKKKRGKRDAWGRRLGGWRCWLAEGIRRREWLAWSWKARKGEEDHSDIEAGNEHAALVRRKKKRMGLLRRTGTGPEGKWAGGGDGSGQIEEKGKVG
jgi:hypothetical protein